jgi:hypothetical protein
LYLWGLHRAAPLPCPAVAVTAWHCSAPSATGPLCLDWLVGREDASQQGPGAVLSCAFNFSEVWDLRVSCLYQKPLLPEASVRTSSKGTPTQLQRPQGQKRKKNQCLNGGEKAEKADSSIKCPEGAQGQTEFLGLLKARRRQGMSGCFQIPNVTLPPL